MRNKAILEAVLSGKDYTQCAKEFHLTSSSVASAIRSTLKLLKEHTDIDIQLSTNHAYIMEQKENINTALAHPLPMTTITLSAKNFLKEKFGKYYARDSKKVAAKWSEIEKEFYRFTEPRHLLSIQSWLASEGLMVGNIMTDTMLDFTWNSLQQSLANIKREQDSASFEIRKVETSGKGNKLIIHAEIGEKKHKVTRRFSVELIPD